MRLTTPGRLLLEDAIPAKYRDGIGVIDSKAMKNIYTRIAQEDPDAYADSIKRFTDVGRDAVYRYGREASLGLDDLIPPPDIARWREQIRQEATKIISTPGVSSKEKQRRLVEMLKDRIKEAPERLVKAYPSGANGLVEQTLSGARGNKNQLMQVLFGDVLVVDAQDKPVPIASLHGYGEGVTPLEYWAASSGSRKGSVSVQFSTAAGGYLGKQLSNLGHRLVVTARDCGTSNGFPVKADDPDNIGSILAAPAGNYPAGTVITKDILNKLGDKPIRVRSLTTCAMKDGVCSVCSGIREKGTLPPVGDQVGIVSSRALSEPITQAGLKCLSPDTPVRMADWSIKAIKDIVPGDMVLGADKNARCFPTKVLAVHNNGVQPVYKYSYHAGMGFDTVSVTCTESHKMLSTTRKSMCKEEALNGIPRMLPAGYRARHFSAVLPSSIKTLEGTKEEPMAFMIGLMIGDGCFTKKVNRTYLSCNDSELIKDLEVELEPHDLRVSFHKGSHCYWRVSKKWTFNGDSARNPMRKALENFGVWGCYAHEKALPDNYREMTHHSLLELVSGIICADGHLRSVGKDNRLMLGLTSKKLVEQVADIIYMTCGVLPPHIIVATKNRIRPVYAISYSRVFDVFRILSRLSLRGVKKHTLKRSLETVTKTLNETDSRFVSLAYGKRVSSEFGGNCPTLDISVDNEDHLFVLANGLIVSNSKHSGGVAGTDDKQVSGFKEMDQFIQVPENFQGGSVLSPVDGIVTRVENAPAGGSYVYVNGDRQYVPRETGVLVKQGDRVTAGDMLSEGTPNPAEIAKYKGIGEARRYFVDKYREILSRNGASVHRRNLEAVARGFISRVGIDDVDGYDGYLLGDVVPYDTFAADYEPRKDSRQMRPSSAKDSYLEKPYLHYSIGTRITPSVSRDLEDAGVKEVIVNKAPPIFSPQIIRSRSILSTDPDWMTRLSGEGLKKSLLESTRMGATSTPAGTSYFPAMANPSEIDKYKGGTPTEKQPDKYVQVK